MLKLCLRANFPFILVYSQKYYNVIVHENVKFPPNTDTNLKTTFKK